jgi:hypothetical protein
VQQIERAGKEDERARREEERAGSEERAWMASDGALLFSRVEVTG